MTVDGVIATLGDKVEPGAAHVRVDDVEVNLDPSVRYYALHKPSGVVTTLRDPQGRPDIARYLPTEGPRVFPVGRLDRESEGLLLLTNDGELANRLMHPSHRVEKEYLAEVEGEPTAKQMARCDRASSSTTAPPASCAPASSEPRRAGAPSVS